MGFPPPLLRVYLGTMGNHNVIQKLNEKVLIIK
jgi:hypothetical protein